MFVYLIQHRLPINERGDNTYVAVAGSLREAIRMISTGLSSCIQHNYTLLYDLPECNYRLLGCVEKGVKKSILLVGKVEGEL